MICHEQNEWLTDTRHIIDRHIFLKSTQNCMQFSDDAMTKSESILQILDKIIALTFQASNASIVSIMAVYLSMQLLLSAYKSQNLSLGQSHPRPQMDTLNYPNTKKGFSSDSRHKLLIRAERQTDLQKDLCFVLGKGGTTSKICSDFNVSIWLGVSMGRAVFACIAAISGGINYTP